MQLMHIDGKMMRINFSVENGVDLRHPVNGEMNGHSGGTSDINSNITLPNVAIECNHKTDVRPKLTCNADVECKCRQRSGGWSYGVLEDRGCSRCCSSMRNSRKILVGHVVLGRNRTNLLTNVGKSFRSGLLNFCAVALALNDQGYRAIGIRIDSGDLAYLSCLARQTFEQVSARFRIPWFNTLTIVASNDINEDTIISLNEQGHKIDCFGIGTHLVTCQRQPALGCVYKLVEINNQARIKLSQDVEKVTMPGSKNAFRLFGADGHALIDLMQKVSEPPPEVGQKVLCRHPFQESKRAYVIPTRVECLYKVYWRDGRICQPLPTLDQVRDRVQASLKTVRTDHKRTLNPTPYKVAVSDHLYNFIHDLWLQNAPIGELS